MINFNLKNKNALVCGASSGIGKAAAVALAELGANVTLLARNSQNLELTIEEIKIKNPGALLDYIACDISNHELLKLKIEEKTKNRTYNILVNNTGGPPAGSIIQAEEHEFIQAFHNHLLSNHLLVKMLLQGMKLDNYGRIINIISTSVKIPLPNLGVSNTIRAAVANWSKTMANELAAFGITVNNVLPGATNTDRLNAIIQHKSIKLGKTIEDETAAMQKEIPMQRFAEAHEVAAAIAFLASPAASYITGINVPVDGGRTGSL